MEPTVIYITDNNNYHSFKHNLQKFTIYKKYIFDKSQNFQTISSTVCYCKLNTKKSNNNIVDNTETDSKTHLRVKKHQLPFLENSEALLKRIIRNVDILMFLNQTKHRGIINLVDLICTSFKKDEEDIYLLTTDKVDTNLLRIINVIKTLNNDHIIYLMYELLCNLYYIHSADIVLQNLNPLHLMVNNHCYIQIFNFENSVKEINISKEYQSTCINIDNLIKHIT